MEEKTFNGYELSRKWFDFCFENPERIKPNHTAMYFFAIEHCNRLGWKRKFGFPSTMVMEAIGIKSYNTYIKTLNDLIDFGFIIILEKSKNQYSANIIALSKNTKALTKALTKAIVKHTSKQSESIDSIDKPLTIKPKNSISFYEKERDLNNSSQFIKEYNQIISYISGKNDLERPLNEILSFPDQLTYKQFEKLFTKAKSKTFSFKETLMTITNKKDYWHKKTSLYLTINGWINRAS